MKIAMHANGPGYHLNRNDLKELLKKGKLDVVNFDERIKGRLSLVDHDPNLLTYPNGAEVLIDTICCPGVRLRRSSGGMHPSDYDGISLFVLRVQRELLEEIVEDNQGRYSEGDKRYKSLFPRCKYDRFSLNLDLS